MTSNTIQRTVVVPAPNTNAARLGQATAVEQSRAIAEVQGAIVVAQQCPRDVQAALTQMRESCAQPALANRSKFRFSRGGGTVSGPSVHLARELARCWGNVQYGVAELRRDDEHGESEMQAFAWDLQTNTRSSAVFIVPHKRDKKGGPERLTDMRDIYESNANAGARRVRECIFAILPPWFTEEAQELCEKTMRDGGGVPLAKRIAELLTNFANLKITQDQIEAKLGRPAAKWTDQDVADLWVIGRSVQRGEINRDDEFPVAAPSAEEIKAQAQRQASAETPEPPAGAAEPEPPAGARAQEPEPITAAELKKLHTLLTKLGVKPEQKHDDVSVLIGRRIESTKDLTVDEAIRLLGELTDIARSEDPVNELDMVLDERRRAAAERDGAQ